jgi:hypothetical protein
MAALQIKCFYNSLTRNNFFNCPELLFLKGMSGALAPFCYLVAFFIVMLRVVMLSVIMLSVVILNVVAYTLGPHYKRGYEKFYFYIDATEAKPQVLKTLQ